MSPSTLDDHGEATDELMLTPQQSDALVRVVEAAPRVQRRHQYFVWTQSQLQTLLPHQIHVCGAYVRQRRSVVFEAFNSIVLPPVLLALLTDAQGALLGALTAAWIEARGRPLLLAPTKLRWEGPDDALGAAVALLQDSRIDTLLVHGVARPQRPAEIESFFIFASTGRLAAAPTLAHLELLLPCLHGSWQRVVAAEREMAPAVASSAAPRAAPPATATRGVTGRERQILQWVRDGKSNQQIAEVLGISPLTVKNHVQKILRKLGASNRAQAVAQAIAMRLLPGATPL